MPPPTVPLYLCGDIVGLAHGLVDRDQVHWLRQRPFSITKVGRDSAFGRTGGDAAEGYLFSKPVPDWVFPKRRIETEKWEWRDAGYV